jgi:hypothetical protein
MKRSDYVKAAVLVMMMPPDMNLIALTKLTAYPKAAKWLSF